MFDKSWNDFSAVKKIIVYNDNNWLLYTKKIVYEKKLKVLSRW